MSIHVVFPFVGRAGALGVDEHAGLLTHGPADPDQIKIPAGWLIEQCEWKGFRKGDVGVHAKQALVLVNYGHAQGEELVELSHNIQHSVKTKFGIALVPEVNII